MNQVFTHSILKWYRQNGRDLPWRHTHDPYEIWVSEIILQQTRVAQGMEYYERFLKRFPDVRSLAEANEDEVLRLWQGLGYYSRARNMHKASKQVMEQGGRFPVAYEEVHKLSGIGDYTAAAITSFAFGAPRAVVDGNVLRVLSRVFGIDTPIDSTDGKKLFASMASELMDAKQSALYNQAIMDFGALQCTPKGCDCSVCPLLEMCEAAREGLVDKLPVKSHRVAVSTRNLIYIYTHEQSSGNLLIHRRGKGDIWQGLYEVPVIESLGEADAEQKIKSTEWGSELLALGGRLTCLEKGFVHQLTHQKLVCDFYELSVPADLSSWFESTVSEIPGIGYQLISRADIDHYGMPRLMQHLFSLCE